MEDDDELLTDDLALDGAGDDLTLDDALAEEPGYFQLTRSATYCFLCTLPLFAAYEVLILIANSQRTSAVRVGADVWTKRMLEAAGLTTHMTLAGIALGVGVIALLRDSDRKVALLPHYFAAMLVESLIYALIMAFAVATVIQAVFAYSALPAAASAVGSSFILNLALSLGAGLYEELFFRVLLFSGLALLLRPFLGPFRGTLLAALVAAIIFSGIHYIGVYAYPFEWSTFTFRFLLGLVLTFIYATRGFAVAAWTHALYDVFVIFYNAA